jgi:O-antigen ligase
MSISELRIWLGSNYGWLLIFAFVLLLPTNASSMVPMTVMAVIGFYQLTQRPIEVWCDPVQRLLGILFLCIWLPMILSLIDAVYLPRSLYTVFSFLLYFPASIFMIREARKRDVQDKLLIAITIIVAFWCIDAMIQLLIGRDLMGYPLIQGNVTGLFYSKFRLGHVLAALSPLFFEGIRRYVVNYRWAWLLIVLLILTVLFTGRRVAWIMFATAAAIYAIYLYRIGFWKYWKKPILVVGVSVMLLIPASLFYAPFLQRVEQTLGLFSGDYQAINAATSDRLPLWNTALAITADHWLNGVGARGFRYICQEYAPKEALSADSQPIGCSTHPHLMLLEVTAEAGFLGVIGYILFGWFLWHHVRKLPFEGRCYVVPWSLAVLVAMSPFNAHLAFYGSYWSSISWWLITLTLAMSDKWMVSHHSLSR